MDKPVSIKYAYYVSIHAKPVNPNFSSVYHVSLTHPYSYTKTNVYSNAQYNTTHL